MEKIKLILSNGKKLKFKGQYLGQAHPDTPKKITNNWHYYQDVKGRIYHIRKEHLVARIGKKL